MKQFVVAVLVGTFFLSGCAMKKVRFVNYHNKCEAINPEQQDFVSYVNCINSALNSDPVTKETAGATKYLTLANRYKDRVIKNEMSTKDASFKLKMDYVGIVNPTGGSAGTSGNQTVNVNATVISL